MKYVFVFNVCKKKVIVGDEFILIFFIIVWGKFVDLKLCVVCNDEK